MISIKLTFIINGVESTTVIAKDLGYEEGKNIYDHLIESNMQMHGELVFEQDGKVLESYELEANPIFEIQDLYNRSFVMHPTDFEQYLSTKNDYIQQAYHNFEEIRNSEDSYDFVNAVMVYD